MGGREKAGAMSEMNAYICADRDDQRALTEEEFLFGEADRVDLKAAYLYGAQGRAKPADAIKISMIDPLALADSAKPSFISRQVVSL